MSDFAQYVESPLAHGFSGRMVISDTSVQDVPGIGNWQCASNVYLKERTIAFSVASLQMHAHDPAVGRTPDVEGTEQSNREPIMVVFATFAAETGRIG